MIDSRNLVTLCGGVVADPEVFKDNLLKLRLGVDFGGNEQGSDNNSGFFAINYWMNNDQNPSNTKFVRSQVESGNLKKGSQLQITGRLRQERWTDDQGNKRSQVVIVAENINYWGNKSSEGGSEGGGGSAAAGQAAVRSKVAPDF